jgi:hypothetical protein
MFPSRPAINHSFKFGINGIKTAHAKEEKYLYFTNTAKGILARVSLDGTSAAAEILAHTPGTAAGSGYDDFTLGRSRNGGLTAYLCDSRRNSISRVDLGLYGDETSRQMIVAWNVNSKLVAEPSDAAFGRTSRDRRVLYVSTAGGEGEGDGSERKVGGQILGVDFGGEGW